MNARIISVGAWLLFSMLSVPAATNEPVSLLMPDGQLRSRLLRVFVSTDIKGIESLVLRADATGSARYPGTTRGIDGIVPGNSRDYLYHGKKEPHGALWRPTQTERSD
jgi:hypothetical protein